MLPFDRSVTGDRANSFSDAAVALMEVTMHKLISVLSLSPALVFSQSIDAKAFDVASLPPIESIAAATDVRPFLAPGVPRGLSLAALRRAWVIDPRIRNFRGLQENDWDFTDPNGMPGFDPFEPIENGKIFAARASGQLGGEIATRLSR
jgi:hypothetical protein